MAGWLQATVESFSKSLIVIALSAGAMTADADPALWTATHTRATSVTGIKHLGHADADQPMRIVVSLQVRDPDGLKSFVTHFLTLGDPAYNHPLSREEFVQRFAPDSRDVQATRDYLGRSGFGDIKLEGDGQLISATAPVRAVEAAFNTRIDSFETRDGHAAIANVRDASLPAGFTPKVLAILGLQTLHHPVPAGVREPRSRPSKTEATAYFEPTAYQQIYGATGTPTGSAYSVALVAEGDMSQVVSDVSGYAKANSLPAVPVNAVYPQGDNDDTSDVFFTDLDSELVLGMAGNLKSIYLYSGNAYSDAEFTTVFARIISDNLAPIVAYDYQLCEVFANEDGSMAAEDQLFQEAITLGQTIVAGAGNSLNNGSGFDGQYCYSDGEGIIGANYPGSSPYALSVGGTDVVASQSGAWASETADPDSGGGISQYELAQSWQKGFDPSTYRGIPDLAMNGNTNTLVYYDGEPGYYGGGTGVALVVGSWTRIWSYFGNPTSFFPPLVYAYVPQYEVGAHDITSGSNGGATAKVGWDDISGFGSFNVYADIYGKNP